MAQGYLICKVCGKKYPYCMTNVLNAFRWQDVACCQEHAKIYFDLVAKARGENTEPQDEVVTADETDAKTEEPKPKAKRSAKKKPAAEQS